MTAHIRKVCFWASKMSCFSLKIVIFLKCHAFHCCSLLWPDDVSVFLFDKDWAVALQALCDRSISFITILFCCWIRTMGLMRKMYNTYIFSLVKVQGIPYFIADITRKRIYRCAACHYLVFTSHLFHLNNKHPYVLSDLAIYNQKTSFSVCLIGCLQKKNPLFKILWHKLLLLIGSTTW